MELWHLLWLFLLAGGSAPTSRGLRRSTFHGTTPRTTQKGTGSSSHGTGPVWKTSFPTTGSPVNTFPSTATSHQSVTSKSSTGPVVSTTSATSRRSTSRTKSSTPDPTQFTVPDSTTPHSSTVTTTTTHVTLTSTTTTRSQPTTSRRHTTTTSPHMEEGENVVIIYIVIGVVIGIIALCVVVGLVVWCCKRGKEQGDKTMTSDTSTHQDTKPLLATPVNQFSKRRANYEDMPDLVGPNHLDVNKIRYRGPMKIPQVIIPVFVTVTRNTIILRTINLPKFIRPFKRV
uniref:Prostate androgen-regulated mucin-like protein 1 n=1 Tax=Bursaphelenchus xylophilus TaxID=6326 RepID=A0A1I7SJ00_BURXY